MKAIIRRGTGESAQQRDVVSSRPQIRTKGDEGYRVGLGATHSGHQDVVAQQGLDQQTEPQEEPLEAESRRNARHPWDIGSPIRSTTVNDDSRARRDSLPLLSRAAALLRRGNRDR